MSSFKWDVSGDGKVDSIDFLSAFDTDKDGQLGRAELDTLADQLSHQLEYNNSLLSQVHVLEQDKLANQRELQAKQEHIKKLSDVAEQIHNELLETTKKFKIAQDVADTMAKQSKDLRLEINSIRRDADIAVKNCEEMKLQLDAARKGTTDIRQALVTEQQTHAKSKEDHTKAVIELKSQIEILQHSNEGLLKYLSTQNCSFAKLLLLLVYFLAFRPCSPCFPWSPCSPYRCMMVSFPDFH